MVLHMSMYYLVETQTPAGYNTIAPIPVTLNINDSYIPKPGTQSQTTKPEGGIYDWTQTASLSLSTDHGIRRTSEDGTQNITNIGIQPDSINGIYYYQIPNNPGVELPHTGGAGTALFYGLGMMLMLAGAAGLAVTRRRKHAS